MDTKSLKADSNKNRVDLVEPKFVHTLGWVLTHGANKYSANNWKCMSSAEDQARIRAALERHWLEYKAGNLYDEETGLPHLMHLACNTMFLHYFQHGTTLRRTGCHCPVCIPRSEEESPAFQQIKRSVESLLKPGVMDDIINRIHNDEVVVHEVPTHEDAPQAIQSGDEGEDTGDPEKVEPCPTSVDEAGYSDANTFAWLLNSNPLESPSEEEPLAMVTKDCISGEPVVDFFAGTPFASSQVSDHEVIEMLRAMVNRQAEAIKELEEDIDRLEQEMATNLEEQTAKMKQLTLDRERLLESVKIRTKDSADLLDELRAEQLRHGKTHGLVLELEAKLNQSDRRVAELEDRDAEKAYAQERRKIQTLYDEIDRLQDLIFELREEDEW